MSTSAGVLRHARTKDDLLHGYFDLIVEQAPVPVTVVDADFRITKVNQRWLEMLGYERSEVLGHRPTEFLSQQSREYSFRDVIPLFRRTGSARSVGLSFETGDGHLVPVLLDAQVCSTDERFRCAFAVLRAPDDLVQYAEASATFIALRSIALSPYEVSARSAAAWVPISADTDDGPDVLADGAEAAHGEPPSGLTLREREVLTGLASGARNKEIAAELGVSVRTVRFHVENIYQKLDVHTRTRAAKAAIEWGLVTQE